MESIVRTGMVQNIARPTSKDRAINAVKKAIWLYFLLIIFEGALRKWILPFLATPLLIVRDPIAVWILFYSISKKIVPFNGVLQLSFILTLISFIFTMVVGHGNFYVAIYGARIILFHFPLIFIIPKVLTKKDVLDLGKAMLWITILMTLIVGLQFSSPQSAWINKGLGGEEIIGFSGALGHARPPGTFSFTNGLAGFYGLAGPIIFYFWLDSSKTYKVNKLLLIAATAALIAAVPLSISRTIFYQLLLTAGFAGIVAARSGKNLGKFILAGAGIVVIFMLLAKNALFSEGIAAFTDRFESASDFQEQGATGVVADRILGSSVGTLSSLLETPFFGYGLGLGTNVGAQLLYGKLTFIIAESEWGRVIGEMGIVCGLIILLIRVQLGFSMALKSWKAIKEKNILPWFLVSFTFLTLIQGQWAQPTSLGFSVFGAGLTFAALNERRKLKSKNLARR